MAGGDRRYRGQAGAARPGADTRVRYLRLTGLDDTAPVAAMSVRMADFQALMNAARPDGRDGLAGRLADLRH